MTEQEFKITNLFDPPNHHKNSSSLFLYQVNRRKLFSIKVHRSNFTSAVGLLYQSFTYSPAQLIYGHRLDIDDRSFVQAQTIERSKQLSYSAIT